MKSTIINLHRRDVKNLGDMLSAPCQYFPEDFPDVTYKDIFNRDYDSTQSHTADVLIVGGGAMLATKVSKKWWAWLVTHHKWIKPEVTICWGVGCDADLAAWPHRFKFKLAGIRHKVRMPRANYIYTPDASVMNKEFDWTFSGNNKKDILFVSHPSRNMIELYNFIKKRRPNLTLDHRLNRFESIEQYLDLISNYKLIVSACYHPALWALWAGKSVMTINNYPTHHEVDRNYTKDPNGDMRCWKLANMTPDCRNTKYGKLFNALTDLDVTQEQYKLDDPKRLIMESRQQVIDFKDKTLEIIKTYEGSN
jgi:hypothetical protein